MTEVVEAVAEEPARVRLEKLYGTNRSEHVLTCQIQIVAHPKKRWLRKAGAKKPEKKKGERQR